MEARAGDFLVCDNDGDAVEMHQHGGPASLVMVLGDIPCLKVEDQQVKDEYLRNQYPVKVPTAMPFRPEVVVVNRQRLPQLKESLGHRGDEINASGLADTTFKHGTTVLARDIDQAFRKLAQLEATARNYLLGAAIGAAGATSRA